MSHHYSRVKIASGHAAIYFACISCFLSSWMSVPWKQEHCSMQGFISATLSLAATILSASYLEVAVPWPSIGSSADPIIILRVFIMCCCQPPPLQLWWFKVEVKRLFCYVCSGDRKQPAMRKEPTTCGGGGGEKGGDGVGTGRGDQGQVYIRDGKEEVAAWAENTYDSGSQEMPFGKRK